MFFSHVLTRKRALIDSNNMSELESLEKQVNDYILENDYAKAIELQRKLITLTKENVHHAHIRLFHMFVATQRAEEAIEQGVASARLCIEATDYRKAVFLYQVVLAFIIACREKDDNLIVPLCYELSLCILVKDGPFHLKQDNEIMALIATQFPHFSESTQYKRLKNGDYDLLMNEEPSQCQQGLLALIKHG